MSSHFLFAGQWYRQLLVLCPQEVYGSSNSQQHQPYLLSKYVFQKDGGELHGEPPTTDLQK